MILWLGVGAAAVVDAFATGVFVGRKWNTKEAAVDTMAHVEDVTEKDVYKLVKEIEEALVNAKVLPEHEKPEEKHEEKPAEPEVRKEPRKSMVDLSFERITQAAHNL